ncbi:ankyrin repeat-containing domain protein [Mycena sanguinolenta]|nr:ankyrin repeat-containing domain protein [Mycena sanguinolenta]
MSGSTGGAPTMNHYIYGGRGGGGGRGGTQGGSGGTGEGPIMSYRINAVENLNLYQLPSQVQEERAKIIDWLSSINSFARRDEIFSTREEGTGDWLLAHPIFNEWKESSGEILWCHGMPGAGKTVLASIVGKHLDTNDVTIALGCIFLDHMDKTQTTLDLLSSLAKQLVIQKATPPETVRKLYQDHCRMHTRPSLSDISSLLPSLAAEFSKVYIIVDALDEYPADDRAILLQRLITMGDAVSLMLTSRDNVELDGLCPRLMDLKIRASDEDLETYVAEHIHRSFRLSRHVRQTPELRAEIISKIITAADGMFLLAKLHLLSLATASSVTAVRKALENLSKDLNSVYRATMDRMYNQPADDMRLALATLTWVTHAKRPLQVAELREALAVDPDSTMLDPYNRPDISIILEVCVGLVIVTDKSDTVRLVHSSTQNFLQPIFPNAHTAITRVLLKYLALDEPDITGALASFKAQGSVNLQKTPLIGYCCYCLEHAAVEPEILLSNIVAFLNQAHQWAPIWSGSGVRPWDIRHSSWPTSASPLWFAASANLITVAEHLLDGGVSPNQQHFEYVSALGVASYYGDIDTVRTLIQRGARCDAAGVDPLQLAALVGHIQIIQLLLQNNSDVNATGGQYPSPLEAAKQLRRPDIIQLLCDNGAYARTTGRTALKIASSKGQMDMVLYLLSKGIKVDSEAIAAAAEQDHTEIVQVLLNKDLADPDVRGKRYGAALQVAAYWGHTAIVGLLLDNGADMNVARGHLGSPLESAVRWGYTEIVRQLLEKHAEPGKDLLKMAEQQGQTDIVRLLLEAAARVEKE